MKLAEAKKPEIFSKNFLVVLLIVSVLTNVILVIQQRNPNALAGIRFAFTPAPQVLPIDHVRGNPNAKYTVIEYADFQCPFCAQFHQSMCTIMKEADVRWVYRHFPLSNHPLAPKAAEASECAGDQGKFWEYSDALFGLKAELTDETFIALARQMGLDAAPFEKSLSAGKHGDAIAGQVRDAGKMGISVTPTLYINGKRFDGLVPLETLRTLVNAKPVK
ncbi:MAG TPA: DsbA family protein [Chitinivibrionales bacterium]|nr:DsbA family protein [Chitinivibrionales bacterium]